MLRRSFAISSLVCAAALAPAAAPAVAAAAHAHASRAAGPVITSVRPMRLAIGQKLTLRGRNFRTGSGRNIVAFRRSGGRVVFVRSGRSTQRLLMLTVSSKLRPFLSVHGASHVATRFSLNVLGRRFGSHFTSARLSPVISDSSRSVGPNAQSPCDYTGDKWNPNVDSDHDLLLNGLERQIKTDPCVSDTDGDGVPDGYEYRSALDLNRQPINVVAVDTSSLPYPGKRPYPNPLDPGDGHSDYDGDGLVLSEEHQAWAKFGDTSTLENLLYSDGTQTSQHSNLTDDRKDVDGDGLGNWFELHGQLQPKWWEAAYKEEAVYDLRPYSGVDWLDADTDGDGIKDSADDSDHDGYSDLYELSRSGGQWVQPFNPCLPDDSSPTCSLHPPFGTDIWRPFRLAGDHFDRPDPSESRPLVWPRCKEDFLKPASVACPAS